MKPRQARLGISSLGFGQVVTALLIVIAAWAAATPNVAAQDAGSAAPPGDPGAVVRTLIEAMKVNDATLIRAQFSPNASQAYGDGKAKVGPTFFAWLQSDIIERKGQVDDPQFVVNGNEVIVTGQFRNNRGYRSAANFRIVVDNGRIASWQMRY